MPSRQRLRRDPDREAAALLECPVVLWPVADLVARPGDLVAARLIGLVGHRASGKRGSGPIRSTLAQPKPKARNFAPTPDQGGHQPRFQSLQDRLRLGLPDGTPLGGAAAPDPRLDRINLAQGG